MRFERMIPAMSRRCHNQLDHEPTRRKPPLSFSEINPSVWGGRERDADGVGAPLRPPSLAIPHRTSRWYSSRGLMVISPTLAISIAWAAARAAWTVVM